jgi:hypothetical protein
VKVFLQGVSGSNYHVEMYLVGNGTLIRDSFNDGNLSAGQTVSIALAPASTAPGYPWVYALVGSAIAVVVGGAVLIWNRRRRPKNPEPTQRSPTGEGGLDAAGPDRPPAASK